MSKLYVLVRGDLSKSQQAVQACHVTAEFMLYCNSVPRRAAPRWENETIVLLKVRDLSDLVNWKKVITDRELAWIEFREPDIGNEITAVAAYGPELDDLLRGVPLV